MACLTASFASAQQASLGVTASTATAIVPVSASANASVSTTVSAGTGKDVAARLAKVISRGDTAITARLTALANLNTRIAAMKNVSADEKTAFASQIQASTSGLTTLKAKLDADTDATAAAADAKTITGSYRIYALIIPQGYIAASADRVQTIAAMLTAISAKLQTRITANQASGKDVTAMQASLSDMNAKIADVNVQAQAAQAGIASLTPDQGNATLLASNTAALKAARADIKTATQDLQAARADAKSIIKAL